ALPICSFQSQRTGRTRQGPCRNQEVSIYSFRSDFIDTTPSTTLCRPGISPLKSAYRKCLPGSPEPALPLCRKPALSEVEGAARLDSLLSEVEGPASAFLRLEPVEGASPPTAGG